RSHLLSGAVRVGTVSHARRRADRAADAGFDRRHFARGRVMATRIFVPRDAAARAVGADRVAAAVTEDTKRKGLDVEIVRTGSRGLFWLEPLVEVETPGGRIGFGPLTGKGAAGLS